MRGKRAVSVIHSKSRELSKGRLSFWFAVHLFISFLSAKTAAAQFSERFSTAICSYENGWCNSSKEYHGSTRPLLRVVAKGSAFEGKKVPRHTA